MNQCLHCKWRKATPSHRGLCRDCHQKMSIRRLYAPRYVMKFDGPRCVHCKRCKRQRGKRGLCWPCYQKTDIRHQYGKAFVSMGVGAGNYNRPMPDRPTDFLPGSEGKVQVMCERAEAGTALWHPEDCCA